MQSLPLNLLAGCSSSRWWARRHVRSLVNSAAAPEQHGAHRRQRGGQCRSPPAATWHGQQGGLGQELAITPVCWSGARESG